jgi:hypothetical protein
MGRDWKACSARKTGSILVEEERRGSGMVGGKRILMWRTVRGRLMREIGKDGVGSGDDEWVAREDGREM